MCKIFFVAFPSPRPDQVDYVVATTINFSWNFELVYRPDISLRHARGFVPHMETRIGFPILCGRKLAAEVYSFGFVCPVLDMSVSPMKIGMRVWGQEKRLLVKGKVTLIDTR